VSLHPPASHRQLSSYTTPSPSAQDYGCTNRRLSDRRLFALFDRESRPQVSAVSITYVPACVSKELFLRKTEAAGDPPREPAAPPRAIPKQTFFAVPTTAPLPHPRIPDPPGCPHQSDLIRRCPETNKTMSVTKNRVTPAGNFSFWYSALAWQNPTFHFTGPK
jgi:hypothetical protein